MKPDWDKLAEELADDPTVFIAVVNCSNEGNLCRQNDVSGYPTIKVWKDGRVQDYRGGRSMEDLMEFVHEKLSKKCNLQQSAHVCSEREQTYATKWKDKNSQADQTEKDRLGGMLKNPMKSDLKLWLLQRIGVLEQLINGSHVETS